MDLDGARTTQIREVLDCVRCPSYPTIIYRPFSLCTGIYTTSSKKFARHAVDNAHGAEVTISEGQWEHFRQYIPDTAENNLSMSIKNMLYANTIFHSASLIIQHSFAENRYNFSTCGICTAQLQQ